MQEATSARRAWAAIICGLIVAVAITGCGDDDDNGEAPSPGTTAQATSAPTEAATALATPQTTPTTAAGGPAAPSGVTISGAIPDLNTPVPPGQGELGRFTVSWQDNSDDEDGFRIFQECDGAVSLLAEVPAGETQLGPLQSCRPGRVGVASFDATAESEIVWAS